MTCFSFHKVTHEKNYVVNHMSRDNFEFFLYNDYCHYWFFCFEQLPHSREKDPINPWLHKWDKTRAVHI